MRPGSHVCVPPGEYTGQQHETNPIGDDEGARLRVVKDARAMINPEQRHGEDTTEAVRLLWCLKVG